MSDNSWIHRSTSRSARTPSKVLKIKITLTLVILLIGGLGTAALNGVGSNATQYQSQGIVIDFGNYNTVWTEADFKEESNSLTLLKYACNENSYSCTINEDGSVTSVAGITNSETAAWGLWYVTQGSLAFTKAISNSIDVSGFTVAIWAYTSGNNEPTVAVDATGTSIYGYARAERMVTLSPVATEIVGSLNAANIIVGTDAYSDYPATVVAGHSNGSIAIVGSYTDPSYEAIMSTSPGMAICDGSQYNQITMAGTLRSSNINVIVLYAGESVETILDNIFIVGTAMNYELRAKQVVNELQTAMTQITNITAGSSDTNTMISLSDDASPYVAGNNTYASDVLVSVSGINIFGSMNGWVHVNSEYISKLNPSVIIIITSDSSYTANQQTYDAMMAGLSNEWKSTDAYKNGDIYLLCGTLGEMAQRSGPRVAQLTEIVARILAPDSFNDGIVIPKYVGDNYTDYLTITKDMGYGGS